MQIRSSFAGNGKEIFGKLFVGALLSVITVGIYLPWLIVEFQKYLYDKTTIHGTPRGDVRLAFTGTGGQLFVKGLVGYLLTAITLGIYSFWFLADLARFYADNTTATAQDGTQYRLRFNGTGGQLFGAMFVGYLLTMITIGIYLPWFVCKLHKLFADNTELLEGDRVIGKFDFVGQGGELFGRYLLGLILTSITLGIYGAWFQVDMFKFFLGNTQVHVGGETLVGEFVGTGGQFFGIVFVGYLLTMITLGIYGFWWIANQIKFQTESTVFNLVPGGRPTPSPSQVGLEKAMA